MPGASVGHAHQLLVTGGLGHVAHHHAQRVNVGALVCRCARQEKLGRYVARRAGGQLEHVERVAVGQPEINQLYVAAMVGHHDVGRLKVAVHNLFAVHIVERRSQLAYGLVGHFGSERAVVDELLQRVAVDVVHHYGLSQPLDILHVDGAADVRVVEQQPYLKLLGQRLAVDRRVQVVGLQALQHVNLAIACGGEQPRVARRRHIALAYVAEAFVHAAGVSRGHLVVYVLGISRRGVGGFVFSVCCRPLVHVM